MANELMIELPKQNALQLFVEPNALTAQIEKMRKDALSIVPDLTTKKGRAEIASMAAKVARTKTYLDDAGKQLCDQERSKIDATLSAVLESRKLIRAALDDLRDEVRKPLTDWENAEAERKAKIETRIEAMKRLPEIGSDAAAIEKHLKRLELTEIDESFGEYTAEAAIARTHAIRDCQGRLDAQVKIEQDLKELEQLRIKQAEQAQKDHEAEIARKAAETARLEAEHLAYLETQKVQAEANAKIAEANRIADEALLRENLAKQQEQDRINAAIAGKEKAEAEENARIADAEYRQRVIEEIILSFSKLNISTSEAVFIIKNIENGNIKNVFIKF